VRKLVETDLIPLCQNLSYFWTTTVIMEKGPCATSVQDKLSKVILVLFGLTNFINCPIVCSHNHISHAKSF